MLKHFLNLTDISKDSLAAILADAKAMKQARAGWPKGLAPPHAPLIGHTLAMLFEKNSTRTRFSFDMGMRQLGGTSLVVSSSETQIGRGESLEDTAIVLSAYVDALMMRVRDHTTLETIARAGSIPVINGLSDQSHPCQIMADLMTLEEYGLNLSNIRIAWLGDGNNVCTSYIEAAAQFGFELAIGTPSAYAPSAGAIEAAMSAGGAIEVFESAEEAAQDADVIVTDTFVSMGDENPAKRLEDLAEFAVTEAIMDLAQPEAVFLHCLPAHRGEEVIGEVIDGPRSLVFEAAENRLHVQKAILKYCLQA